MTRKFKYIILLFLYISVFSGICTAQNRTWITYEVGVGVNQQSWNSSFKNVDFQKSTHSIVGAYIEQELNNYFSLEIGINDKYYGFDSYHFAADTFNLMSYAQYIQIPLRLRSRIHLFKNRIFLSPHIGLDYMNKQYSKIGISKTPDNLDVEIKKDFPNHAILFEGGLSLELVLKSWKFALLYTEHINQSDFANYKVDELDTHFSSSGSYRTLKFRIGYAVSNLWAKKKNKEQ
ncbi:MAG: hypothetical protein N4A71_01330 [Carboxylicivirga sp.]|jgi:hypothetical protein|nr:hypothetical protein [Carboxylicivirga sp.]